MSSNVHVSITWKNKSVFAGEDLECIITFTNLAGSQLDEGGDKTRQHSRTRADELGTILERQRNVTQSTAMTRQSVMRQSSIASTSSLPFRRSHRHTVSMGVHPNTPQTGITGRMSFDDHRRSVQGRPHGRALSIWSLGTESGRSRIGRRDPTTPTRVRRGHARAVSLQMQSRRDTQIGETPGASAQVTYDSLSLT